MNEHLKNILDKKFYEQIGNKEISNPKVLLAFAGVPFSGRTAVAKELEQHFQGLYLDKDYARTLIYENEKIENVQQPENIFDEYIPTVFERLKALNNGLIILDASIDRKYQEYKDWSEKNGYHYIVISLEVDRVVAEETTKKERDEKTAKWFIEQFGRWYADHEKFKQENKADFTIRNIASETPILLEQLEKIIK